MSSAQSSIALTRLFYPSNNTQYVQSLTSGPSESAALSPVSKNRQIFVLISSFLTIVVTIGLNQAYGVFQAYYISSTQTLLTSTDSPALVAFVGTFAYGLTWSGSIFINPLLTRMSLPQLRKLCILGVLLMSLGFGLASIATTVWQLLLTQGLLYGAGSSLLYFPILSSAPEYFDERRGSAMGFILSGSGIGGLIFSPLVRALLSHIGPRWTLRVLSLIVLVVSLPIAVSASPSRFLGRRTTHVNLKMATKPTFLLSVCAGFLQAGGNGLPLTFLAEYSVALGFTAAFGANLLAVNNAVNAFGRILTGWIGDRVGRQNTLCSMCLFCVAAVAGLWLGSVGEGGRKSLWLAFVVTYGMARGGYNTLFPTTIAEVFGLQAYASVNGFIYFIRGLGTMFGSPVGGKILGESNLGN
ncbi:related to protein MCH2 (monocarboxylate permease homolog) [Rhynchosporium agropyri]|uniref:Related to protein MCH2 (Monocarboxylate permease homolog) n=1 Tax=Rhynchosporium agropyri TaxID=914238 RepID=A0A1E1KBH6_9HELO|nr:related to protein MCH2 (monocarboxylate permease homolog) [Rhynchosporium agropyri]